MKTTIIPALLLSLIAIAQTQSQKSGPTALDQRIERQVRAYTEAPPNAQVTLGARTPSNFAGYENLPVIIEANGIKKPVSVMRPALR